MNTLLQSLNPSIGYALGWTIIHSFWQASLIALIMSVLHRFRNHKRASFKYGISVLAMASVFIVSVITFAFYYSSSSVQGGMLENINLGQLPLSSGDEAVPLGGIKVFFAENLEHINLIWGVGVLLFLARFVFSYAHTLYLRKTANYSNSKGLEHVLKRLKTSLCIDKAISIAESSKINVPLVLGHFKPLILFPIGLVNILRIEEVEAIITHELAHIKRHDYLTNIMLTFVEILFYFHPAVWWISANVKAERENCCDDFALSQNIDKVIYAKALVKLEEIKSYGIPALAMPFSSKKHQLSNRIKRIMNMPQTQNDIKEKSIATILLLSIVLLFNTQANSKATLPESNIDAEIVSDTLRLAGNDEMVLTVKEGRFRSLEIDNEIRGGEIVDKLAASINGSSKDKNNYTVTFKERPTLEIIDNKVGFKGQGGVVYFSEDDEIVPRIELDTLPNKKEINSTTVIEIDGEKTKVIEVEKKNGEVTMLKIDDKEIPKSEYGNYKEEIESVNEHDTENNTFKHFDGNDFSESFGLMFDGNNWREFGGNFEQLLDSNLFKKLEDMEHMRFDFKEFENFDDLKGLERLGDLKGLGNLEQFKNLDQLFKELGIKLDTTLNGMNFRFQDDEGLNGFEFFNDFDFEDEDNTIFRDDESGKKRGTVVDKIGKMLNRDGLLEEYKANKIEITGKHLKINGEKMPKALYEKYKNIYQEATGAPLTKNSKMVFDVEGKPSKRKVKTF